MGRRSSRPSGGRRPASRAHSRASSSRAASPPTPRRAAAPPPVQKQQAAKSTAPATKQNSSSQSPAPAAGGQPSAMGGFMANVASTGLGVMAGRAMDRAFFGGGGGGAESESIEDVPVSEAPNASYSSEYMLNGDEISPSVCAQEVLEFKKCMEKNSSDIASCKWNLDVLAACQQQQQQTGFADAGRF